jgi:hypothetical protein
LILSLLQAYSDKYRGPPSSSRMKSGIGVAGQGEEAAHVQMLLELLPHCAEFGGQPATGLGPDRT